MGVAFLLIWSKAYYETFGIQKTLDSDKASCVT